LEHANGSYNSVFTNHQYQLSESRVNKILEIKDFEEGLKNNLRIFQAVSIIIIILASVIAFVLILISANLVIEENSKSISTFKVLGYSDREISNLVVNTYTPLLVFGYLLALPISIGLMNVLKIELETKFELPMMLSLGIVNGLLGLAVLMLTYFAGLRIISSITLSSISLSTKAATSFQEHYF
jgi:putative ABC transport system permease protein